VKLSAIFKYPATVAFFLFTLMVLPLFVSAQKKPAASAPSKPAAAAKPAQAARPAGGAKPAGGNTGHTNTTTPGHSNTTTAGHTNTTTAGHTNTTTAGHTNTTTAGHTNTTTAGHTNTTTAGHTNTTTGGHTNTTTAGHTNASSSVGGHTATSAHADGSRSVTNSRGDTREVSKTGRTTAVTTKAGNKASFNSRGGVSTIHTAHGATITHSAGGQRQAVSEHRDANGHVTRVVSYGHHGGYVEHGYSRGGHEYMRRTYVGYGGHAYAHVYRGYYYHGGYYYGYVPGYYYGRGFYGWAYNPWPAPFAYGWGWGAAAWYNPYAYYFAPYPVYPSAAFWLTDYLISQNLQAAYAAGAANAAAQAGASSAPPAGYGGDDQSNQSSDGNQSQNQAPAASNNAVTLTPEVKQMIADEVKAQLAAEQAQAAPTNPGTPPDTQVAANTDETPAALDPKLRVFIVSSPLDVNVNGQSCSLSSGDVLMRTENTPGDDKAVGVSVVSSKKEDCASGSAPRVQVSDLQDMHNSFQEQMDNGLKSMADNKSKFPNAPDAGAHTNPDGQAAPDLTAASDVQAQQQDADQAEQDVQQASTSGNGGN